jgi:hypothetical protein
VADPIVDTIRWHGEEFQLVLHPTASGFKWYLNFPSGHPLTAGQYRVESLGVARYEATDYLRRMWPEGRSRPDD